MSCSRRNEQYGSHTDVRVDPDDWAWAGLVDDFWTDLCCLLKQSWVVDRVFDIPESWERPDASWRRMHLTDPPMVFVKLDIEVNEGRKVVVEGGFFYDFDDEDEEFFLNFQVQEVDEQFCTYRYLEICNPRGVTTGEIFDALKREFWSTPAKEGAEIEVQTLGRLTQRGRMV